MSEKADFVRLLTELNPRAMPAAIAIYVDALIDYRAAQSNIDEHGSIVLHPRTGAPIPNPYLPIREKAAAQILKIGLKSGSLWTG